jgi:hypothetical protein
MAIERITGGGGGYAGIEAYYSAKIERIELEKIDKLNAQFASVLSDVANSARNRSQGQPELPAFDRGDLRQPNASPALETSALNTLRSSTNQV